MSAWLSLVSDAGTPRLKNEIHLWRNTEICQTEYCKTLDMLGEKIHLELSTRNVVIQKYNNFSFYINN